MNKVKSIDILNKSDQELEKISKDLLLSLDLAELKAVRDYFKKAGRNPTDAELETIAQTWSEHCKHKSLTASVDYTERGQKSEVRSQKSEDGRQKTEVGSRKYENLLKETVFKVTQELNKKWCISVFKDNAGIIEFDRENGVAFKVETHNHPSAIEPYGGAGTGIGGVIRDIIGVGLGAKPILNTDVFCFGPLDAKSSEAPDYILHPKRIFKGVVSGVRDYGNRMGIPTANGAVYFDKGYIFNPLVYCGTLGLIPKDKCFKKVSPGDIILAVGGRTGRDGIHGATFSSISLDKDTEVSAVQIGNAIMEKKFLDTVLQARDKGLYSAITDCGAGGFSSAVGELGEDTGVRVCLERAPLKYEGLLPWEIWLSEAQERMVLAVPKKNIKKILKIFHNEDVETTLLGEFTNTGRLEVLYEKEKVCDLDMVFLHKGVPKRHMQAQWEPPRETDEKQILKKLVSEKPGSILKKILASPNVCSKEWIIRQYDHEVQAQTAVKPLHGRNSGPGDACVMWPYVNSSSAKRDYKGIAVSCGLNPVYGFIDPYWMAASAIDEALRNIVCVGGNLDRAALLDNFCWGSPRKPEQLAGLVRASQACYDIAKVYQTPFISGKDSLHNEYKDEKGEEKSIPATLLISAVSVMDDIRKSVTMDLKKSNNIIYILGITRNELGGSHLFKLINELGSSVPKVFPKPAKKLMEALQKAISRGAVSSCHDCSEGGLAVSCAEMCFAGGLGMEIYLNEIPKESQMSDLQALFSESNSRFVVEVAQNSRKVFETTMKGNIFAEIGLAQNSKFKVYGQNNEIIIDEDINNLKEAWDNTLKAP